MSEQVGLRSVWRVQRKISFLEFHICWSIVMDDQMYGYNSQEKVTNNEL